MWGRYDMIDIWINSRYSILTYLISRSVETRLWHKSRPQAHSAATADLVGMAWHNLSENSSEAWWADDNCSATWFLQILVSINWVVDIFFSFQYYRVST